MRTSSRILVGRYDLGCRAVDLYARGGTGGSFDCAPASGVAEIVIGMSEGRSWRSVFAVLMHEAMELALTEGGRRFAPTPDFALDHAAYMFVMDHTQFGEATARAAHFIAQCAPDLVKVYDRQIRRGKETR